MRVGLMADSHDHLDNMRWAVDTFNRHGCDLVLFAGDFVSTFVLPPLRRLACPLLACPGDNDANRRGLRNGLLNGLLAEGPFGVRMADGCRILVTHELSHLRGYAEGSDVVVYAHTHKPCIQTDSAGRLLINPGEASGWTYRQPTIALLETNPPHAEILFLPPLGPVPEGWQRGG